MTNENASEKSFLESNIAEALKELVGDEGFSNPSYTPCYLAIEIADRVVEAAKAKGLDAIPVSQ